MARHFFNLLCICALSFALDDFHLESDILDIITFNPENSVRSLAGYSLDFSGSIDFSDAPDFGVSDSFSSEFSSTFSDGIDMYSGEFSDDLFSDGYFLSVPSSTPSLFPTTSAPSLFGYDTKTEFNFDFSVRLLNVTEAIFGNEDFMSGFREAISDVHQNVSYGDVTIVNFTSTTMNIEERRLNDFTLPISLTQTTILKYLRRHLKEEAGSGIPAILVFTRIRGVLERYGRFKTSDYSSFRADFETLLREFISSGRMQTALRTHLQERGIFRSVTVDRDYLVIQDTTSIDYVISRVPTPAPSKDTDDDGGVSPLDNLNMQAIVVLVGALVIVCVLIGVCVYRAKNAKIKHVSVGCSG